ncbi:MAG: Mut7-C RNAse domain-containing protein [Desulfobacteraceae bacterium]
MNFVADIMLGKLAKWLRVMGYDTIYQSLYGAGDLERFMNRGRILLTRHRERAKLPGQSILLHKNRVGEQLAELRRQVDLPPDPALRFSRCLRCNTLLREAPDAAAREAVPEYVYYQNPGKIRFCPTCERHYWPGSHRIRMEAQLREWGLINDHAG